MVHCIRLVWHMCWCFWWRMPSFAQTCVQKLLHSTCSQRAGAWSWATNLIMTNMSQTNCLVTVRNKCVNEFVERWTQLGVWMLCSSYENNIVFSYTIICLNFNQSNCWWPSNKFENSNDIVVCVPNCFGYRNCVCFKILKTKHNAKTTNNQFSKQPT